MAASETSDAGTEELTVGLVVQKYGGSSVADAEGIKRVAKRIVDTRKAGNEVVVVVSAMGGGTDELLPQDDIQEPLEGLRVAVDQRRPEQPRAQRQLEVEQQGDPERDPDGRQHEPGSSQHARVDDDHRDHDARREEQRERMVRDGHAEHRGSREQPPVRHAIGPRLAALVARADPRLPPDEQQHDQRDEREMQGVRVGVGGDAPGDRGRRKPEPRGRRDGERRPQPAGDGDGGARGDRDEDRRQEVHPEGRIAQGHEDDRGQPAEQHVRRKAGRVHHAEQRPDGLGFSSVPEPDARQQGRSREAEREQADDDHDESLGDPGIRTPEARRGGEVHPRRRRLTIRGGSPRPRPRR